MALAGLAVPAFAETSDAAFDVLLGRYVVADPDGSCVDDARVARGI